jgi:hypothetical protein
VHISSGIRVWVFNVSRAAIARQGAGRRISPSLQHPRRLGWQISEIHLELHPKNHSAHTGHRSFPSSCRKTPCAKHDLPSPGIKTCRNQPLPSHSHLQPIARKALPSLAQLKPWHPPSRNLAVLIQCRSSQTGLVASESGFDRIIFGTLGTASAHVSQTGQRNPELIGRAHSAFKAENLLPRHTF